MNLRVTQTDKSLTVESTFFTNDSTGHAMTEHFMLDGSPSTNTLPYALGRTLDYTTTAVWSEDVLMMTTNWQQEYPFSSSKAFTKTDRYSLSDDRETLTHASTMMIDGRPYSDRLVFVKQSLPKPATALSNEQGGGAARGPCAVPDSIAISGLSRLRDADVRSVLGITPGRPINGAVLTQALKNLYATNGFEADATTNCELIGGKSVLVFNVTERRTSVADSDLVRVGYAQRKQTATGFFADANDIDRRSPLFSDAVRALPGLRITPTATHIDPVTGRPLSRTNEITSANGGCLTTFVDGAVFKPMAPGDIDDVVSATQLIAIELYQPPNVPPQFVSRDEPTCATLVVWTQELRRRRR